MVNTVWAQLFAEIAFALLILEADEAVALLLGLETGAARVATQHGRG